MHIFYFAILLFSFTLFANDDISSPEPSLIVTKHTAPTFPYTATTGTFPLFNDEEQKIADIFFIAYTKDNEENRPITFVFPGGPGGSATKHAIFSFGPHRLLTSHEGQSVLPPYKIIDNPESILDVTDLIFVDPANCGFSKTTEDADLDYFYSLEGDIHSLGQFVHSYVQYFNRWNAPKYIAGGSYGTMRCTGLALALFEYDIAIHGMILDGCAFEMRTLFSKRDHALPDCLLIPTFAATAWYYGRLWPEKTLDEVTQIARNFAFEEYAINMLKPNRLNLREQEAFNLKLSHLIGLPVDTVRRYNGRINEHIYTAEFFHPERKVLGGLDTRYSGDISTIDPDFSHDPSYLETIGFGAAFNHYLQTTLDTVIFKKYVYFSDEAFHHWFALHDNNLLRDLRHVMVIHPKLQIFVGLGYYDARTPFAATEYCFEHLDLPESFTKNLHFNYYEAGHGFIYDYNSLKKYKSDLQKFYSLGL